MKAGLVKRIRRLEANRPGPSIDERTAALKQRTLEGVSDHDLDLLEQVALLQESGREKECTAEQRTAAQRYEEAYMKALSESHVRFTVNEMDQILGAG